MQGSISYWELDYYRHHDFIIVGGGITGINAAINLKLQQPWKSVLVIDNQWLGGGASSKNAGFVCFGSPTEIMDDISNFGEIIASDLIARRWEGSIRLMETVPHAKMDFVKTGGVEVFDQGGFPSDDLIEKLNEIMIKTTSKANYFTVRENFISDAFHKKLIFMKEEGRINPKKMMSFLYQKAIHLDIHFINDHVINLDISTNELELKNFGKVTFDKCGITLNGYINNLLPDTEVKPARNLVIITEDIPAIQWDSVVHYNKGYVYFRRIGDKILLGGGRNLDPEIESSDKIEINQKILNYLKDFLQNNICEGKEVKIIHHYVGILGFGKDKIPVVKPYSNNVYLASGLGGMGVAIGSQLGKELADQMIS
jgi:gamma-glutamylputrescine oxidase